MNVTIYAAAFLASIAQPAAAAPVEGRLVLSAFPLIGDSLAANVGLEGEFGPRNGYVSLGATSWALGDPSKETGPWRGEYAATAFVRGRIAVTAQDEVGALIGHNYRYLGRSGCAGTCEAPDSNWLVLGLTWLHQTERYWLRVTPQYELSWEPRFVGTSSPGFVGGWTSWGLPWVEGGLWLSPGLGIGARIGPGITQAVWRF